MGLEEVVVLDDAFPPSEAPAATHPEISSDLSIQSAVLEEELLLPKSGSSSGWSCKTSTEPTELLVQKPLLFEQVWRKKASNVHAAGGLLLHFCGL